MMEEAIKGERIYFLPMKEKDTKQIIQWRNQDFVRKNFIDQRDFTEEGHHNWIEKMINTQKAVQFIVYLQESNRAIGSVYLRDIDREHLRAELGIFLGEQDVLQAGYGTEAVKLLVKYGFSQLGLHKIMLRVLASNHGARKAYEKAGFAVEGRLEEHVLLSDQYEDVILMAVINSKK